MNELADGWVQASVRDVVDILDSERVPVNSKERALRPGNVPYYGATGQVGLIDCPLFNEELCLLGEDGAPFLDRTKPHAYVIDGPSWVNNHAHVLRAVAGITSNRFLKYVFDWTDYAPYVNGTTRLKLTKSAMCRIPIPLPPLAEQERMVEAIEEHVTRLDAAETLLRRARAKLRALHIAVLTEAITGPAQELGFFATDLRYGTSIKCTYEPLGPPVLRIPNIQIGRVDTSDLKFASDPDVDLKAYLVGADDLLFVRTNGSRDLIGRVASTEKAAGMAFASYLIRVRLDSTRVLPRYAVYALSTPSCRAAIEAKAATSAGQYNLNLGALKSLKFPVPSVEDQRRIVARVEKQFSLIDSLSGTVDAAFVRSASLRRSILERAFTGKLVSQDPSDEPASVLLERIAVERAASARRKPSRQTRVSA